VRVAAGDLDGDGRADLLTAPGSGGGPHVRAFDGDNLSPLANFFAYGPTFTGGVFVAAPAAGGGQPLHASILGSGAAAVDQEQLDLIVAAAISQWEATSLGSGRNLRGVNVRLADLPGAYLGLAYPDLVLIDSDAAGHGWSVGASDPARMDLLTAVAHELGHVLGLEDQGADGASLMAGELSAGVVKAVDQVFSDLN
jgi:hypothetical protein